MTTTFSRKERIDLASRLANVALESLPDSVSDCAAYLGIQADQYDWRVHFVKMIARRSLELADELIEAATDPIPPGDE